MSPAPTGSSGLLRSAAEEYPLPIARACQRCLETEGGDAWQEWERLAVGVLSAVLRYLSHLLLSDLAATGARPPQLFHRIQSVLSRPMLGHYAGFLRQTARYYRERKLACAFPELIDFLLSADVDCTLTGDGSALIGTLVEYRNLWAHGRLENRQALQETADRVRHLTFELLRHISFLTAYPLQLEDGTVLMGTEVSHLPKEPGMLVLVRVHEVGLRPLLLKLKGRDIGLLDDFDAAGPRIGYRGAESYVRFTKKDLGKGDGKQVLTELLDLLKRVRAIDAPLERPEWDDFRERAGVIAERTLDGYKQINKYVPDLYVPHPGWHGQEGVFQRFLGSDRTLLAVAGEQGTGKSALLAQLASEAQEACHAVLFLNAQRFTFADADWSGNPFPNYFSCQMHYVTPFAQQSVARLMKTVPAGKRVVMIIDALNEVDGIERRWNRFRAAELLLEWVAAVAQPGLKVIVSLRLEAFEEFNALRPNDLPGNLNEISWPGNNPRHPWITDLAPFGEPQAEALYRKLQENRTAGMMPSMSWEVIREGLGGNFAEYVSNPLMLLLFLRAHNGVSRVQTIRRQELFERYTARLTGRMERWNWPWWRRVGAFLKNGDITPREQFLLDVVSRMAEEGSTAFLLDRLNPRKSKRDKRLLEFMTEERFRQDWDDLKHSGLLVEEPIEVDTPGGPVYSRRISFVAELTAAAMEPVEVRQNRLSRAWSLCTAAGLLLFIAAVLYGLFAYMARRSLEGPAGVMNPADVDRLLHAINGQTLEVALPFLALLVVCYATIALNSKKLTIAELGLTQWAFFSRVSKIDGARGAAMFVPLVLVAVAWMCSQVGPKTNALLDLVPLGVAIFLLCWLLAALLLLPPERFLRSWLGGLFEIPMVTDPRLVVPAYRRRAEALSSRVEVARQRKLWLPILISGLLPWLTAAWFRTRPIPDPPVPTLVDPSGINMAAALRTLAVSNGVSLVNDCPAMAGIVGIIFVLGLWGTLILGPRTILRHSRYRAIHEPPTPVAHGPMILAVMLIAIYIPVTLAASAALRVFLTQEQGAWPTAQRVRKNVNGRIRQLTFGNTPLSVAEVRTLAKLRELEELSLPVAPLKPVDVSAFSNLKSIRAPLAGLTGFTGSSANFTVLDPGEGLSRIRNCLAARLEVVGRCTRLGDMRCSFPVLKTIAIPEDAARSSAQGFIAPWNNLEFLVKGPSPRLDWLTPEHIRCILALDHPITAHTQNMDRIDRLSMEMDGLEPEVLRRATRLRTLLLSSLKPQSPAFYQRIRAALATGLPNLESLFIGSTEAGKLRRSYNTSRHARRADMLAFLEALEAVAEGRPEPGR